MPSIPDARRAGRLQALFKEALQGNRQFGSGADAKLFFEAIQNEQPPSSCVEKIISSPAGLDALRVCMRVDVSPTFVLSYTLNFIRYLSDPVIKALADGQFLRQILEVIASPPTTWNSLLKVCLTRGIPEGQLQAFAWLALELLSLASTSSSDLIRDVQTIVDSEIITKSATHETRNLGYRICKVLQMKCAPTSELRSNDQGPGGRHDNDFENFREIAIYPTRDEFLSKGKPFYRTMREVFEMDEGTRAKAHLDNQFRLLREDMLAELREDLHVATGLKKGKRPSFTLGKLDLVAVSFGDDRRAGPCSLGIACNNGLQMLQSMNADARKRFLLDNRDFLKHQAFGVLYRADEIYGFAFVDRDVNYLSGSPPVVLLRFTDDKALSRSLFALKTPKNLKFTLVDTPVFAYEPVLSGLTHIIELPLQELLLSPKRHVVFEPVPAIQNLVGKLAALPKNGDGLVELPPSNPESDISSVQEITDKNRPTAVRHGARGAVKLDESQLTSLLNALQNPLTLIQGPPGTGKSFIGANIAKCIYEQSTLRIIVISYTNHALDQFLADLRSIGISPTDMVRLGSTARCAPENLDILLGERKRERGLSHECWHMIGSLKSEAAELAEQLKTAFEDYRRTSVTWEDIKEFLEFSQDDQNFYAAFNVPEDEGGWKRATGRKDQEVGPDYLYRRWSSGQDAGIFQAHATGALKAIWDMPKPLRQSHTDRWLRNLISDRVERMRELVGQYNDFQERLADMFKQPNAQVLRKMRIIGCTTTVAANNIALMRQAEPDIVLVEEAGEILESHILTSLVPSVKQIILIGDHKQLRPKVNNYALTVEKGEGFDLNCSLFERLIKQGAPYTTLRKQHRMAPEISMLPRHLTYPDLVDGPNTAGRPTTRGLQDRVIFLNHGISEMEDNAIADRRESGAKASKKNPFEAEMVLKCVKYLAQQGYGTENMVVLTPYLGQLRHLRDMLKREHDPVLSDLDSFELVRAGLLTDAASKVNKKPLRISTIDNYQGEESDIVVASLTRSNSEGDIGFMKAPERLNVLLSRARNCLILIGNMETFINSRRGNDAWISLFELLKANRHLYDGLPVKCEKHPERTALISKPEGFERECPDGGCAHPCGAFLKCGLHKCVLRCHREPDHSKTECLQTVEKKCDRRHSTRVRCGKKNTVCSKCFQEDEEVKRKRKRELQLEAVRHKELERRVQRDLQLEADRLERQDAYARELQILEDELEHHRRLLKDKAEGEDQKKTLAQRRADVEATRDAVAMIQRQEQARQQQSSGLARGAMKSKGLDKSFAHQNADGKDDIPQSKAKEEWEHLKKHEMAKSPALDELMDMIGLEDVKQEILSVKNKVDTAVRQGISLAGERLNCSLLGNPGTVQEAQQTAGKTTIARLYARFLTSVGVISGTSFEETTGSSLAQLGVSGCKKLIDDMLNKGGGVLFIDEAYQLTNNNSHGGGGVLDYLLPEVERLTGKVVFVLAGYSKQMESFFAHNPGLPSRFPIEMKFADYTDDEILRIFEGKVEKKYSGRMQCDDGLRGLYCRIIARRIGRGRGRDGFGNARAVENMLATVSRRQADRLRRERRAGREPDDMLLTKEDLIGPEPSAALASCEAMLKLESMIGLTQVKEAVKSLVDSIQQNYKRELSEEPLIEYSLNRVFLGSPGTGKTTVARLYGKILVALGLLSKGEVIEKNPSDFVGGALGQSEQQTKGILAATEGKVLLIDEAYGLYGGGNGSGSSIDPYKTAVVDTIVANVQSVPGDDRCVLLLGYKDQMEEMFQNVNPGLSRRFPIASAFNFEDFDDSELRQILDLKLKQQGFKATDQAKLVGMEMLGRARNRPNFGNAGEIDIILDATKARHQRRFSKGLAKSATTLEPADFDEDFDRATRSETNVRQLFEDTLGCDEVVARLEAYQDTVRTMKELDMDPKENIPFNFLFRGPPGTGKTTTARKMGKVFCDMGFLSTAEVVECSATDLIGQYVGHTGPKVQQLLDKALGRVLFVDEAYRLAGGHFAGEAMDELVDSTTKPKYHKKLVIILAGYEEQINQLMASNPGLSSRFSEVLDFRALTPHECVTLLVKSLRKRKAQLAAKSRDLDLEVLEAASSSFMGLVLERFSDLVGQESWASARDVQTLAKGIFSRAIRQKDEGGTKSRLKVEEGTVDAELLAMIEERAGRAGSAARLTAPFAGGELPFSTLARPTPTTETVTTREVQTSEKPDELEKDIASEVEKQPVAEPQEHCSSLRDAGVSDEVWEQLQQDRKAEEAREDEYRRLLEAQRRATDLEREKIVRRLLEEQRRREREAEIRKKLKVMGLCPVGYAWVKQSTGYRCAGGSHFLSDSQLQML